MAKRNLLFVQSENGTWEFRGETYEQHLDQWQAIDSEVQADKWKLSAVAASLDTRYKDDTVGKFAKAVKRSARRIRQYAQTHRAFENGKRFPNVSFHHHTVAAQATAQTSSKITDLQEAMEKAEEMGWGTRDFEAWIKTGKEPSAEPKSKGKQKLSPTLQKIHDDAVRAELEERLAVVKGWTEPVDPILRKVYRRIEEILEWQRDRTTDTDCAAILSIFEDNEEQETEGLECASDADIQMWLNARGFIMSEDEIDERLELMVKVHMLYIRSRAKSKNKKQRGVVTGVYEIHPEYLALMADAEDNETTPPTATTLLNAIEEFEAAATSQSAISAA